jgi:hypothetical protein
MAAMRRVWVTIFMALLGLGLGIGLGLYVGWVQWPVEYYDTEITDLREAHQADYVLMVSDAYALTGDLDAARERLSRMDVPDVAALVLSHAEASLAGGAPEAEVGRLSRLAAALGAFSPALTPYLMPTPAVP